MKERIIKMLNQFSDASIIQNPNPMFIQICNELDLPPENIHEKSKRLLEIIVHNYAAFDISTIDGFTHKLIRTFAFDLKLPFNFEVELNSETFLNEAVDNLIAKAGADNNLTKILVDFSIEKADDDKSWDIAYDFNKIGKLLFNEYHLKYINALKNKSFEDFEDLKRNLKHNLLKTEGFIVEKSVQILSLLKESGLEFEDFSGKYLPNHFLKLSQKQFDLNFEAKWQEALESKTLYPKRVSSDVASIIEDIQPQIASVFQETKTLVFQFKFLKAFYKNITPLSVLHAINKELINLKEEQNKILISDFNLLVANEIKGQPTPFIYERIGEKFRHYFIDEFQDTSIMQWQNLIPLIDNALSSEKSSAMIVGDAKQAIYRWRGGKAEQFIGLLQDDEPFQIKKKNNWLIDNYRSSKEIVKFNNGFFKFLAKTVFDEETYKILYDAAEQSIQVEDSGYVELNFLEIGKEDNRDLIFGNKTLEHIKSCLANHFQYKDICILVRKREKEALPLANFLISKGIPIVSSDSLLLVNSPKVQFIHNFISLLINPKNDLIKVELLSFLISHFNINDKHEFYESHINLSIENLLASLSDFEVHLKHAALIQLSLYDVVESVVRHFNLIQESDAYVQSYMDFILDFSNNKGSDFTGFINHFEKHKNSLSISSPSEQNAVQIMTIHKSKGLEFPVVIFPYADLDIYREIEPQEWFEVDGNEFSSFNYGLINYNKDIQHFGEQGQRIYSRHRAELELDNINLLYVTLTRAVEHLYIISKNDVSQNNVKQYSEMFIGYLKNEGLWSDSQLVYQFGQYSRSKSFEHTTDHIINHPKFISSSRESHNINIITKSGYLWDTEQEEAIEKGNLIHDILSHIYIAQDIESTLNLFINDGIIDEQQSFLLKERLLELVENPKLKPCFNKNLEIYNEQDILDINGHVLRPDRIVINNKKEAIIVDYKTGIYTPHHQQQLQLYQDILESMGLKVLKKHLVYLNNKIKVVTI